MFLPLEVLVCCFLPWLLCVSPSRRANMLFFFPGCCVFLYLEDLLHVSVQVSRRFTLPFIFCFRWISDDSSSSFDAGVRTSRRTRRSPGSRRRPGNRWQLENGVSDESSRSPTPGRMASAKDRRKRKLGKLFIRKAGQVYVFGPLATLLTWPSFEKSFLHSTPQSPIVIQCP